MQQNEETIWKVDLECILLEREGRGMGPRGWGPEDVFSLRKKAKVLLYGRYTFIIQTSCFLSIVKLITIFGKSCVDRGCLFCLLWAVKVIVAIGRGIFRLPVWVYSKHKSILTHINTGKCVTLWVWGTHDMSPLTNITLIFWQ